MKRFEIQAAQGDLLLIRIDDLPIDVVPVQPVEGEHTLSFSETGHRHVVPAVGVHCFRMHDDDMRLYLDVSEVTTLRHLRPHDTHAPISIQPGKYEVRRQREWTPAGWRRAAD